MKVEVNGYYNTPGMDCLTEIYEIMIEAPAHRIYKTDNLSTVILRNSRDKTVTAMKHDEAVFVQVSELLK